MILSLALKPFLAVDEGPIDTLASIESLFNQYAESRGDTIDELEYTQPPMIQFQCLKVIYESIGESFEFSNKYYDTISGEFYYDISTAEAKTPQDGQEYHYTYDFTLGIGIKFVDNLITADVSFEIAFHQGESHYNLSWFVKMYLDYDFNSSSPTYTMLMLTSNEESDLPTRLGYTYEYDFVKVNNSKITEWRKFYYETDARLVKDIEHPSFDSYKDNVTYKTGNLSWYKNNNLRKVKDIKDEKNYTFAKELFTLGLNRTDIAEDDFFKGDGIQTSKIADMYRSFSNIFGKDFIYSLIASESKGSHEEKKAASVRFYFSGTENVFDNMICSNIDHEIKFGDLFVLDGKAWNGDSYPEITYMDKNGGRLGSEDDLDKFRIFISYSNETNEVSFEDYVNVIFKGENVDFGVYAFDLTLVLKSNETVRGSMRVLFNYQDKSGGGSEEDNVIVSIGIEGNGRIVGQGGFSIVDDITLKDIFVDGETHREYNEYTGGIDTHDNYTFVYLNSKGEKISEIALSDITFGVKDWSDETKDYMLNDEYGDTKISELWYRINTSYYSDGLNVIAISNNKDLEKEQNQCKFTIFVKRDIGGAIPLHIAIESAWPTNPIEVYGLREDFPYVNPSQNVDDDSMGKYSFYFDNTGTWATLTVRLTEGELDAYLLSIDNDYGYRYNGINEDLYGWKEYIKEERRLYFGYPHGEVGDVYFVEVQKAPGVSVPDVYFDNMELDYNEEGYQIGMNPIRAHGIGISEDEHVESEASVTYYFENGNNAYLQTIKEPGTYKITVEIRYSGSSKYNFFDRRITANITIKPAS